MGIAKIAAAEPVSDGRKVFRAVLNKRQGFRVLHRQGAHQNGVHEAVDGAIRADAKRQRESSQSCEGRILADHPKGVAQILAKLFEKCPHEILLATLDDGPAPTVGTFQFLPGARTLHDQH